LKPDFISVTYGAGGSGVTNPITKDICSKIKNEYKLETIAHLSCINNTKDEIDKILEELKKVKIAVLDDSKFDRLKMSDIFSASEIKNVDFFEKAEDLENSNKDYEVYIIDMVLAESSGEEVVVNIRKKDKYVPILAVSAIENSKTISQVLLKGATDYIVKPYNKNVFLARIEIALRNYKIIKELLGKIANE
jgi:PleD family two-component response regulator